MIEVPYSEPRKGLTGETARDFHEGANAIALPSFNLVGIGMEVYAGRRVHTHDPNPAMPLRARVHLRVPANSVAARVSPELRPCVDSSQLQDQFYNVICYPGKRGESSSIVDSTTLKRAMNQIPDTADSILVVAHNFTAEAKAILTARSAMAFSLGDSFWSDESWAEIRDLH